jgi:hypothetical protein
LDEDRLSLERGNADWKEIVMRGKPYAFVVSLYCTLMLWSAGALGNIPAGAPDAPEVSDSHAVAMMQDESKKPASFKETTEIVATKGDALDLPKAFCSKIGIILPNDKWTVRHKKDETKDRRFIAIGSVKNGEVAEDVVVLFLAAATDGKKGRVYLCQLDGTWVRGYERNGGDFHQVTKEQAEADLVVDSKTKLDSFSTTKSYWVTWLGENARR